MKNMQKPLALLKKWFQPPAFPEDDDETRVAAILNLVLWILLILVLFSEPVIIIRAASTENPGFLYLSAAIAPALLFSVLYLLRKGYVNFAAWAFVLFQWISANAQVLASGGMDSPALSAFIVSILIAGFLISNRVALLFTGLSLFSIVLVMIADANHLIPPPILFGDGPGKFRMLTSTILVTAAMLSLIIQSLKSAIQKARTYARELELERETLKETIQSLMEAQENIRSLNETLESRVQERTAELEAAMHDLESFSFSISHDLRAPLRGVNGYTKILREDFSDDLTPQARDYLDKIQLSASKMAQLIDELLSFSRVGRGELKKQIVSVNGIVRAVIESLLLDIKDRAIEWEIKDLPSASADPVLLNVVFTNLIDNAIKYTRGRNPALITIDCLEQDGQTIFSVSDNGAGFAMQHSNKLFGVFQRLHHEDEFEGTGIGLATVQRIIHHHGGRIWAEAELDKGATFFFTLV